MKKTMYDIVIPKLSEKIIDCQVARWLKEEGDYVMEGEVIVELETEKTTIEIESPCEGILTGIYVFEGEEVIDGERIGVITSEEPMDEYDDDEDDDDLEEYEDEFDESGLDEGEQYDEDYDDEFDDLEDIEYEEDIYTSQYYDDDYN